MRAIFALAASSLIAASLSAPASARQVDIGDNTESNLKKKCKGKGVFFPTGEAGPGAPYACLMNDGTLIVCGGSAKPIHKRTCSITRIAPPDRKELNDRLTIRSKAR
jgi:hypothetical protein